MADREAKVARLLYAAGVRLRAFEILITGVLPPSGSPTRRRVPSPKSLDQGGQARRESWKPLLPCLVGTSDLYTRVNDCRDGNVTSDRDMRPRTDAQPVTKLTNGDAAQE